MTWLILKISKLDVWECFRLKLSISVMTSLLGLTFFGKWYYSRRNYILNPFKKAIKHYNYAIKSFPKYPIALNNLASAQQRLLEYDLAYETYKKVLLIDPNNKTAIKKSKELEKRNDYKPYKGLKDKGF